jgi:hypothetical protein
VLPNPATHCRGCFFFIPANTSFGILMTDRQQIELIRNLTLAQLTELRATPKPTYSIDGQTVSWTAYIRSLQDTVDWCDAKLIGIEPFEVQSQATT